MRNDDCYGPQTSAMKEYYKNIPSPPTKKIRKAATLTIDDVLEAIKAEVLRSNTKFNSTFVSTSEWSGVLREEYIEFEEQIHLSKEQYAANDSIKGEAIQVAAMCVKGILSLCDKEPTKKD